MKEEDEDPFGSLTRFSLIPASQSNLLRTVPFDRQHEDHFPYIDSQPDPDQMPVTKMVKKRVLSGSVDFSDDPHQVFDEKIRVFNTQIEGLGGGKKVFDEMRVRKDKNDRVLTSSVGSKRFLDVGDKVFDELPVRKAVKIESLGNKSKVLTGSEVSKRVSADLGGKKVFDEMPMRKAVKIEPLGGKDRVLTGSEGCKGAGLGGDRMGIRNLELRMGIEVIDLEEDCEELGVRKEKSKMGPDEDTSTRVLDLDANETCDDLPIRNAEAEVGKNPSADVGKGGDLTTRNVVGKGGLNEGDEVCRDGIRGFREKGIGGIDNGRFVTLKDYRNFKDNSKRLDLYTNLSPREKEIVKARNKVGEPCRDENRGSSEKGIEKIDRCDVVTYVGGSRKACGDEPCRDENRGSSEKGIEKIDGRDVVTYVGGSRKACGDEPCRDGIRGFREQGIGGIDNGRFVSLKDCRNFKDNSKRLDLYTNLSPREKEIVKARNKVGEPCRDENRGLSEKGIEKINRRDVVTYVGGSRKACDDEPCRDGIRGFREKDIRGIDNGRCVSLKDDKNRQNDKGNTEGSELYEESSHRNKEIAKALNKVGEPCRDANRGSSKKGIEEINRREENNVVTSVGESRKACGDESYGDVIRGCSFKETNISKDNNIHQEGKSQARKLPSSFHTLAETGIRKIFASHCGRNKKAVEKNICENETSEPVSQKSKDSLNELLSSVAGETTNDQIMKNLLDGLDLIIGGQKETVDNASDGEVDILETAMKMGIVFPRPRWWPDEGFDDE